MAAGIRATEEVIHLITRIMDTIMVTIMATHTVTVCNK